MNDSLEVLPRPSDVEGPAFEEPWQAQAFSILVALHDAGHFPWKDWVQLFSGVIKRAPAVPGETASDAYYRQWASALEEMAVLLGAVAKDEITSREQEWHRAYLNTPHGLPVYLLNAECPPARASIKSVLGAPLTVSAAQLN